MFGMQLEKTGDYLKEYWGTVPFSLKDWTHRSNFRRINPFGWFSK
jgi:hypothetical protein